MDATIGKCSEAHRAIASGASPYPRHHLRHPSAMECLAGVLERSGGFRVLRRLDVALAPLPDEVEHRLALFVDVETTGLDPRVDGIIQLACVPFGYDPEGRVTAVYEPLEQLRDPGTPIPAEITRLTGIDDDMVRGRAINVSSVESLVSRAALVVAHNAAFDRSFLERLIPGFAQMPWACSMTDLPWREEGATTLKLEVLALQAGFFYEAHQALNDCLAAVELLRRPLPLTGRGAMAELLRSARRETARITAVRAPFERKDLLKRRAYRWREPAGGDGPKAWTIEIASESLEEELRYLREEVYGTPFDPPVVRLTAYDRYSDRV
ncbi:3'-5' exonuclease [Lichenihabitans sp. Uapishka_5]|uniref:3'-5' exonuclease n=1 Tax=Lichenihabitans sp. Uapishka_5 TaxID=3037302 RepID=UPI0029E7DBAA|nr:3'-5' exonuclease [Lichenihabitans sp. Uapishka_5]MDX7951446.1 3'-5' exonuclease [Lichenihabitans sp. Uapishka_5]